MINHCMFNCYFGYLKISKTHAHDKSLHVCYFVYLKISKTHAHDQIHSFPSQKTYLPVIHFLMNSTIIHPVV